MMRLQLLAILTLVVVACSPTWGQQPPAQPAQPTQPTNWPDAALARRPSATSQLAKIVLDAFGDKNKAGWDRDLNGSLSAQEIARAVLDPRNRGEQAAAAAALHDWITVLGPSRAPKIDRAWLEGIQPVQWQRGTPILQTEGPGRRGTTTQAQKQILEGGQDLDARFGLAQWRLRSTARPLYPPSGPSFDQIRQGDLGDCFMLAPLAAMAHRDPEAIRKMITPIEKRAGGGDGAGNGGVGGLPQSRMYRVTFGDGRSVEIPSPTDAELALPGALAKTGMWVRLMEKAFGTLDIPTEARALRCPTDGLQQGEANRAGATLTGHTFQWVNLIGNYKKQVSERDLEGAAANAREKLKDALESKRLVIVCNAGGMPKSIIDFHTYAVIGYDEKTDKVELYNTWSERFTPKGAEGFENGYAHQRGIAHIPMREFVHAFTTMMVETEREAGGRRLR